MGAGIFWEPFQEVALLLPRTDRLALLQPLRCLASVRFTRFSTSKDYAGLPGLGYATGLNSRHLNSQRFGRRSLHFWPLSTLKLPKFGGMKKSVSFTQKDKEPPRPPPGPPPGWVVQAPGRPEKGQGLSLTRATSEAGPRMGQHRGRAQALTTEPDGYLYCS